MIYLGLLGKLECMRRNPFPSSTIDIAGITGCYSGANLVVGLVVGHPAYGNTEQLPESEAPAIFEIFTEALEQWASIRRITYQQPASDNHRALAAS